MSDVDPHVPSTLAAPMPSGDSLTYQSRVAVGDRVTGQLRTLAIFWYIWAALNALVGSLFIAHIVLGILGLTGHMGSSDPDDPTGWILLIAGVFGFTFFWVSAILAFFAARALPGWGGRPVCYLAAIIACLNIPFGLTLAIITFVLLARPRAVVPLPTSVA